MGVRLGLWHYGNYKKVLENRMLRRTVGTEREEVTRR
jgi:hypothetical protein